MTQAEYGRRYAKIREAAKRDGLDAVVVSGQEYTGFEGAVWYLSGFQIVHRYAYVVLSTDDAEEPSIVFPREARWVGEHGTSVIADQQFVDKPGEAIAQHANERGWKRIGVYGMEYVMTVRDYQALSQGSYELVPWDVEFDHVRAIKSDEEMGAVRESMSINEEGFWVVLEHYEPGKTEAELMAPAEALFTERGCGRLTMDMVLSGQKGSAAPEFKIARDRRIAPDDLLLYSLEVAGPDGYWVEFSRPIMKGKPSKETQESMDAYNEYFDAARKTMKVGATAHDVHMAVSKPFFDRGFKLGHVTGHSIGMTMIEFPKIGEGVETVLAENMVLSMHPHAITEDDHACMYMQDTWVVGKDGGIPLSEVPVRIFDGSESRPG
jgi:Xaa-Pro aminopeptidase